MNEPAPAIAAPGPAASDAWDGSVQPILERLLAGGRDGAERLVADLQKGSRELAALSLNYNGHSSRTGVHHATLAAIDGELAEAASVLARVHFGLQQRLLLDVHALTRLARLARTVDLEDERPPAERAFGEVDAYAAALGASMHEARAAVADLSGRLRVLANNMEIAVCRSAALTEAPVELFIAMAGQMRAQALRLQAVADDLTLFEQTQGGNAEAARVALLMLQDEPDRRQGVAA